jgi:hypothetical protein
MSVWPCVVNFNLRCIAPYQSPQLTVHVRPVVLSSRHQVLACDCGNDGQQGGISTVVDPILTIMRQRLCHGPRRKAMRDDLVNCALSQGYPLRPREVVARVL